MASALPACCGQTMTGMEYRYDHPVHYDGISEWRCEKCGRRVGRWTRRELQEDEYELPYGQGVTTTSRKDP